MGLSDIVDNIKSKIPFLSKEDEDSGDMDFGSDDLNFGDEAPAAGATGQPAQEEAQAEDNPFGGEQPAQQEESFEPEPQASNPFAEAPQKQPTFAAPQAANPFAEPQRQQFQPVMQPAPAMPQYQMPQQASPDSIRIDVDNIKQRIENLMHKFDTISAELDTIRSENDFEKALLQRYDFYLRDIVSKIDNMEKQHEAMWNELRGRRPA